MGRMTIETIKSLYQYGKKLYLKELDLKEAVYQVHSSHPEVAESSARHYINWYSKMREGEFLTWNTNANLLLYYAEQIILEEGIEVGQIAIKSARGFAQHAGRKDLEQDLDKLVDKYLDESTGIDWWPSLSEYDPAITKEQWMELLRDGKTFTNNAC